MPPRFMNLPTALADGSPHHLMHYKKEAIVLIIRKILTELRFMTPIKIKN